MLVPAPRRGSNRRPIPPMTALILALPPLAAIAYSLVYLLLGGGCFGAVVIFIVAKTLRK